MKNTIFQAPFFLFSLIVSGALFAQSGDSDRRLRLDVSARATTSYQRFSENEGGIPDIDAVRGFASVYFGSAYRLGGSYALNERLHFGFGVEVQFTGFRSGKIPFTDTNAGENEVEIRTVDRLLGLGAAFGLRYDLSPRFYLRAGVTPTWISYCSSKVRVYPKGAFPGLSRETDWEADYLRNLNLLLNFGVGYGFPLRVKHRLYLEYGAEYYGMSFLNRGPLNRRILGATLKEGVTL